MKCENCHQCNAQIKVNETSYCLKGYIEKIRNDQCDISDIIGIYDKDGRIRRFQLFKRKVGDILISSALEIDGYYEVQDNTKYSENHVDVYECLLYKTIVAVTNKTLDKESNSFTRIMYGNSLKERGTIEIEEGKQELLNFIIDGENFSINQLTQLLSSYVGWSMVYTIQDKSRLKLRENEILLPVSIAQESLVNELKDKIDIFTHHTYYISSNVIAMFKESFQYIIEKLDLLVSEDIEMAQKIVDLMVNEIKQIKSEDLTFQDELIFMLNQVIDRN